MGRAPSSATIPSRAVSIGLEAEVIPEDTMSVEWKSISCRTVATCGGTFGFRQFFLYFVRSVVLNTEVGIASLLTP